MRDFDRRLSGAMHRLVFDVGGTAMHSRRASLPCLLWALRSVSAEERRYV